MGQSLLNLPDSPGDHCGCEGEAELCGHPRAGAGNVPSATPVRGSGRRYDIRNEQERAALRQQYTAIRVMYTRWQQDLLAAIPTARIVELPGANLFMFLSNEADVLREIRAFAGTLTGQ